MAKSELDRLLTQLNTTQLSTRDNPTYQVIRELIRRLRALEDKTSSGVASGGGSSVTVIERQIIQGLDGSDGEDGMPIPGPRGADGAIGPTGAQGPAFPAFVLLAEEAEEIPLPIPGPQGIQGATGSTGAAGASFPFMLPEPDLPEDPLFFIPSIPTSNGGSAAWTLIEQRACTGNANEDFLNLSAYNEIRVLTRNITRASGGVTSLRVSTDNGSTFLSASGDYIDNANTGIESNTTSIPFHITTSVNPRSGEVIIRSFNASTEKSGSNLNITDHFIIPTTTALNAIRIFGSGGGNLNAGDIFVWGR